MSTQQIVGVVGGVIGAFFGYPQLGFVLGSLVGAAITPGAKTEGPRLNELSVQGSAYGGLVPVVYGAYKLSGNVIFASDIREVAVKTEMGKGGGPTHTEFTYNVDIAIALCDNEIVDVRKIFNDGKLIYDSSSGAPIDSVLANDIRAAGMRLYLGTETQMPDPTIEATRGAGNVSAYRGTAYIVFDQLDCKFGRIPQLSFEVLAAATHAPILASGGTQSLIVSPGGLVSGIQPLTNVSTNLQPTTIFTQIVNDDLVGYVFKVDVLGSNYLAPFGRGPQTGIRYQNAGVPGNSDVPCQAVVEVTTASATTGTLRVFNAEGAGSLEFPIDLPDVVQHEAPRFSKRGNFLLLQLIRTDISGSVYALFDFDGKVRIATYADTETGLNCVLSSRFAWVVVDLGGVRTLRVHSLSDLSVLGSYPLSDEPGHLGTPMKIAPLENGNLGLVTLSAGDSLLKLWEVDEDGRQTLIDQDPNADAHAAYTSALMADANAVSIEGTNIFGVLYGAISGGRYTVTPFVYRLEGVSVEGVGLDTIIADVASRSGMGPAQIDVSELTETVDGYALTGLSTARASIEPLLTAFFIDPVTSDGVVTFRPRAGQGSVATIGFEQMGGGSEGSNPADIFPLTRTQESDLPRSRAVSYANKNDDYQVGTEVARRIITNSVNDQVLPLAVVMDADRAATIASALLYNDWAQRNRRTFKTTREFAALDAGDVVTVEYPRRTFAPYQITRTNDDGQVCTFEVIEYDGDIFTVDAPGSPSGGGQVVRGTSPSQVRVLDIPILQDADDNAGVYVAVSSFTDAWPGASLFVGIDEPSMDLRASFTVPSIAGAADSILGDWTGGLIDELNTVVVTIASGDLYSVTREELLAGRANAAVLGDEILQFRTATLISGNTYRLSGLLRGQRGTEAHRSTHLVGDRFVTLDASALGRVMYDQAELNEPRKFKAVTIGQPFADAASISAINTGEGLKPFSPVNLRKNIDSSGNTVVTWDRRTRLSENWLVGTVPLGEATEAYNVIVTTLLGVVLFDDTVTSASWEHPSGATNLTNAIITVRQVSATYGLGAPATLTV